MHKFIPSFVLAFVFAVSFLVPVQNVFAISGIFQPSIIPISETKKQISNYSYVCPKVASVQPSFFERLLAAVGITRPLPAQKLAESTCGEPDLVRQEINSSYKCYRVVYNDPTGRRIWGCREEYSKYDKKTFSSKYATTYGVTSCTTTHDYYSNPASKNPPIGVTASWCEGPRAPSPSHGDINYPPTIDIDGIGSFSGRRLVGANLAEDFSVTESVSSNLAVLSANGANTTVTVPISVALTKLVLNTQTKEFDRVLVPCTSITVAGKVLDKNCQTTVVMSANSLSGRDVTPKASVPYYTYSVFVSGAITEK